MKSLLAATFVAITVVACGPSGPRDYACPPGAAPQQPWLGCFPPDGSIILPPEPRPPADERELEVDGGASELHQR